MPRKTDSNSPSDWLSMAAAEVEALQALVEREIGCDMCRGKLAEVLEKIMKAELIRRGWFLERTHDLERLRKEIGDRDPAMSAQIQPLCASLAEVYFSSRYPGFDLEDPDWPDLRAKLAEVTRLLEQVRANVAGLPN